jgi:hypothetical protein
LLLYRSLQPLDPSRLQQGAVHDNLKDRLQLVLTGYEHCVFNKPPQSTHHAYHPEEDEDIADERQVKQQYFPHNPTESFKVVPLSMEEEGQDA